MINSYKFVEKSGFEEHKLVIFKIERHVPLSYQITVLRDMSYEYFSTTIRFSYINCNKIMLATCGHFVSVVFNYCKVPPPPKIK